MLSHLRTSFKIFLEALDIVKNDEKVVSDVLLSPSPLITAIIQAQLPVIVAFKELTVKLNEAAFKPLFRRLFDWAFVEDPSG